eukprot:TRINITY_DN22582_c0_g1_i1.p1 TRINITY_DN22582_c0_g1~~TRINITY_DN22582_c0_g1_i1.p1  ORF type:complete len:569 (+),score=108.25 TRINITY_DN22582_c0_g1_i1:183-1889(+)
MAPPAKRSQASNRKPSSKPRRCRSEAAEPSGVAAPTSGPLKRSSSVLSFTAAPTKRRRTCDGGAAMHKHVIKVFASHCKPNYEQPWCSDAQNSSTSSAFPVRLPDGHLALVTNAHSVEYATLVQVKRHTSEEKFVATVICYGPDCDLALLRVDDAAFWKGLSPFHLAKELPDLQDAVWVLGYPMGGESISVTQGVVSRVDLVEYAQSGNQLLGVQIDAAINAGNSGGPAVDKYGSIVGVAFEALGQESDAENIGYIIPVPVLTHFLEDYARNGTFSGFGAAGFESQSLESATLRESMGLKKGETGVRVKAIDPAGPASKVLQVNDVLLKVSKHRVGNDGTVAFERGRVSFSHLFHGHFPGDECTVTVRRGAAAAPLNLQVTLQRQCGLLEAGSRLCQASRGRSTGRAVMSPCDAAADGENVAVGPLPRYLVVGGLVFVPLSTQFLESAFGEDYASKRPEDMPVDLLSAAETGEREGPDYEGIVLTQVLAGGVTIGYTDMQYERLRTLNGEKVMNLRHLDELVSNSTSKYLTFEMASKEMVVLDRKKAADALAGMLAQSMIPAARSAAL